MLNAKTWENNDIILHVCDELVIIIIHVMMKLYTEAILPWSHIHPGTFESALVKDLSTPPPA